MIVILTDSGHDYDFEDDEFSSDSSDDDCLCNTMLITGPHSSGKTCIIYALAQELGYKVCLLILC